MSRLLTALLAAALAVVGALQPPAAASARLVATTQAAPGWGWPVDPVPSVGRPFTAPPTPWGAGHRGVDLLVPAGTIVLAPADGVVVVAGPVAGRGVVAVQHPGGWRSAVEPVLPLVPRGTRVARGDPLAVVSDEPGHCAPRACLHWGVRRDGRYVDPLALAGAGTAPAVLLPLRGSPAARSASPWAARRWTDTAQAERARPPSTAALRRPAWPGASRAGPAR